MPKRDLTPGSLYMRSLEMLEQSWHTMAALFPEVSIWEVGNEWNLNAFLHPDGFLDTDMTNPFTADEKIDIAVDMMYFSARGVRRGNPAAKVTSFSPALSTPGLGGDLPDYLPVMFSGVDEVQFLRQHAGQVACVHLKDFKKGYSITNREKDIVCVGEGVLNLPGVLSAAKELGLPEQTIAPHTEKTIVLNAGEERCAFVKLHLSGGKGAQVELLYSECYELPEGDHWRKGKRTDAEHGTILGYTDYYSAGGAEKECYEPSAPTRTTMRCLSPARASSARWVSAPART